MGGVARAYPHHPESKRVGPDGKPCHKMTEGQLTRRSVRAGGTVCVGKEAHRLEERDIVTDLDDLVSIYADPRREPWSVDMLPKLRAVAVKSGGMGILAEVSGLKARALRDVLAGRSRPRENARLALAALVRQEALPSSRICHGCSRRVTTIDPRRRYCSRECRERAKYARRRPAVQ